MAAPPSVRNLKGEDVLKSDGTLDSDKLLQLLNGFSAPVADALQGRLTFDENFRGETKEVTFTMPTEASTWTNATLIPNWVAASNYTMAYRILPGGQVEIRGNIKNGVINTTAFTLPEGYRPEDTIAWPAYFNGAVGYIKIEPDGDVVPFSGASTADTHVYQIFSAVTPAAPKVFTGGSWPIVVSHSLNTRVQAVEVVAARLSGGGVVESVGNFTVDWEPSGTNSIKIKAAWGLQWGKTYVVRIRIYG
jgi:hypothetical protein